jgi:phosphatidylinositol alpha-mannosyltransferase
MVATSSQMIAWALQWLACLVLLRSIHLVGYGLAAPAAAVLFAINVSAVLPVTPSNVGIFQAACVAVLVGGFHVPTADAVGYGIVLQAVELATAVVMGAPALIGEGLTWRTARSRAVSLAPVSLAPDALAAAKSES